MKAKVKLFCTEKSCRFYDDEYCLNTEITIEMASAEIGYCQQYESCMERWEEASDER